MIAFRPLTDVLLFVVPELKSIPPMHYPALLEKAGQGRLQKIFSSWVAVAAGICFVLAWLCSYSFVAIALFPLFDIAGDYLYCRALRPGLLVQLAELEQLTAPVLSEQR